MSPRATSQGGQYQHVRTTSNTSTIIDEPYQQPNAAPYEHLPPTTGPGIPRYSDEDDAYTTPTAGSLLPCLFDNCQLSAAPSLLSQTIQDHHLNRIRRTDTSTIKSFPSHTLRHPMRHPPFQQTSHGTNFTTPKHNRPICVSVPCLHPAHLLNCPSQRNFFNTRNGLFSHNHYCINTNAMDLTFHFFDLGSSRIAGFTCNSHEAPRKALNCKSVQSYIASSGKAYCHDGRCVYGLKA